MVRPWGFEVMNFKLEKLRRIFKIETKGSLDNLKKLQMMRMKSIFRRDAQLKTFQNDIMICWINLTEKKFNLDAVWT